MRGFRFWSSDRGEKLFLAASPLVSSAFGRTRVGLWPTKRSSPSHARKNLWYPGYLFLGTVSEFTEDALSCRYSSKRRWHPSSIILAYSCIRSFSFNKKFSFFSSSDSRKLFRHFFKVYFCINISVAAPLPENEVAILFWDNIPYLHFSNTGNFQTFSLNKSRTNWLILFWNIFGTINWLTHFYSMRISSLTWYIWHPLKFSSIKYPAVVSFALFEAEISWTFRAVLKRNRRNIQDKNWKHLFCSTP